MLYADGGHGKSVLATYATIAVASGTPFLGYPTTQSSVLYIDFELSAEDTKRVADRIQEGLELTAFPDTVWYLPAREDGNDLTEILQWLPDWIVENEVKFIVLDSLSIALETEPQEARPVIRALKSTNWLKAADCAMLILDHQRKKQNDDDKYENKTPLGTVVKRNLCRAVWQLEMQPKRFVLRHEKDNFLTRLPDLFFRVDFGNDVGPIKFITIPQEDIDEDKRHRAESYQAVLACVNENPEGIANQGVVVATGIRDDRVAVILSRLGWQKQIKHLGRGLWAPK
jgi:hypothetical protein